MSVQVVDDWERCVMKKFPDLVRILRPSLLMDHLRARNLLVAEEYRKLRSMAIEEERSRVLLHDYLPTKGRDVFHRFCEVLGVVDGQQHVLKEILQGSAPVERPTRKRRSEDSQSDIQTRGMAAKAMKSSETNKRASFIFEPKYKEEVKKREAALKKMCQIVFEIDPGDVTFFFRGSTGTSELTEIEHPCQCSEIKLICLVLYGVSTDLVRDKRENLIDCITAFLQDENVSVTRKSIKFSEALDSSAFVVLPMEFEAYFTLFCVLSKAGKNYQLGSVLQSIFTGLTKAVLRMGGLPPVTLLDEQPDIVAPADSIEWEMMSDEEVEKKDNAPSRPSTVESRLRTKDYHGLPPIACDIPISQLPDEVRRRIIRSCDNSDSRKEDCQQYLLSHFPDYFESESDARRTKISHSQVGFMDNLIQFLAVTVTSTLEGLYTVLHDLQCQDACHIIQRYLMS